jgi:hypothetical protein
MNRPTFICLLTIACAAPMLAAHAETLYRYLDPSGRVVYSDQPPPPTANPTGGPE